MTFSSASSCDTTGRPRLMIASSSRPTLPSDMVMSILETDQDWSSLLSLTSATSPSLQQNICSSEVLLQDPQVREKQKPQRTWPRLWQCSAWCSTVLTAWTTRPWVVFSAVWLKVEPGLASMSSIVSISRCYLSSLSKFSPSSRPSNDRTRSLSFRQESYPSTADLESSSL